MSFLHVCFSEQAGSVFSTLSKVQEVFSSKGLTLLFPLLSLLLHRQ